MNTDDKAYREAFNLATAIQRTEFPEMENWQPLEDTAGLISQIDNMYAGVREQRDYWKQRAIQAEENPPKHDYWSAGDPECPKEIKAGNGELHTLRCKKCGKNNPGASVCREFSHEP